MLYFLILLCLILLGVAGLQFMYMFYMDRMDKERKKRLREVEKHCNKLKQRLALAESRLKEKEPALETAPDEAAEEFEPIEDDNWDDILEDKND